MRNRRLPALLLLFYFAVYSVAQISYLSPGSRASDTLDVYACAPAAQLRLFSIEIFFDSSDDGRGADDEDDPGGIILRKKRAVLFSGHHVRKPALARTTPVDPLSINLVSHGCVVSHVELQAPKSSRGYHIAFTGLSPPLSFA